jgi:DNA polymerase-3 subunit delta'
MNEDAADALLKDLEEPPEYAVIILLVAELPRLPETIRSRCQIVPFRRLSPPALEAVVAERRPEIPAEERAVVARLAGGRLDRLERLLDPDASSRRASLIELARSVYLDASFDPYGGSRAVLDTAREAGERAASADPGADEGTAREREQRARRIARGAEREEIVEALDLLAGWYRDVLAAGVGATRALANADRATELAGDLELVDALAAERAVEAVLETRRSFELNVTASLALEVLFLRLRQELAGARATADV